MSRDRSRPQGARVAGRHQSEGTGVAGRCRGDVLIDALADAGVVAGVDESRWECLLSRAREANLAGTLAERIADRSLLEQVPRGPRAHLDSARIRAAAQATAIQRELVHLDRALRGVDTKMVLLKGAAYRCAGLRHARGRTFSDVDILVAKRALAAVESALTESGFVTTHTNPYDQRYYREWMHELPPMVHVERQTVVDVHHALVPETSRMHPDSTLLLADAVPLRESRFHVLSPPDMAIHCATHLFCDEEFSHAPRDLVDFDGLVREFGQRAAFWEQLVPRARRLDLARPLAYALHWSARIHRTPVPAEVLREARADLPPIPFRPLMNALLGPALRPTRGRASTRWARRALYVRGHWLKMPPHLLAWHLSVKAFRREEAPVADGAPEQAQG